MVLSQHWKFLDSEFYSPLDALRPTFTASVIEAMGGLTASLGKNAFGGDSVDAAAMQSSLHHQASKVINQQSDDLMNAIFAGPLGSFQDHFADIGLNNAIRNSLVDIGTSAFDLSASVSSIHEIFEQSMPVSSIMPQVGPITFLDHLPDIVVSLECIAALKGDVDAGADEIEGAGYTHAIPLLSDRMLACFADIASIVGSSRRAVVTRRLLSHVRTDDFRDELNYYFDASARLQRRSHIIDRILDAHRRDLPPLCGPRILRVRPTPAA